MPITTGNTACGVKGELLTKEDELIFLGFCYLPVTPLHLCLNKGHANMWEIQITVLYMTPDVKGEIFAPVSSHIYRCYLEE